jgi:hypothetical protein
MSSRVWWQESLFGTENDSCGVCHEAGGIADVRVVHGLPPGAE